jgi:hypothetical protein
MWGGEWGKGIYKSHTEARTPISSALYKQAADSRRQTADSKPHTGDNRQRTADSRQKSRNSTQQAGGSK